MRIETSDEVPIKLTSKKTSIHKRPLVEETVQDILEAGIIERSLLLWSFPIVVAKNPKKNLMVGTNFRTWQYPLTLIDDILSLLGKVRYFSTIDLRSGY